MQGCAQECAGGIPKTEGGGVCHFEKIGGKPSAFVVDQIGNRLKALKQGLHQTGGPVGEEQRTKNQQGAPLDWLCR